MSVQFNRPIPGQSLTSIPKNAPYEKPPEISNPEEALYFHLTRLTDKKRMFAALDLLETGIDLQTLVEGILRSSVMNGVHSIDVGLLIAPVIHEYIKLTADEVGIEYDEGFEDKDAKKKEKERTYMIASTRAKKKLEKLGMIPEYDDTSFEEDAEETPQEVTEKPRIKPKGLMERGDV